jgi:hypothetical protein
VDRKESKGGDGGMVNCAGRGEYTPVREIRVQARGTHTLARAMLVNDRAAALGSRGVDDDDGMARLGPGLLE